VLLEVLKEIKPSDEEREYVMKFVDKITNEIRKALVDIKIPISVEVHGSIIHDTWLSRDRDIDIFILVKEEVPKSYLKDVILKTIKDKLPYKFEKRYAEHPYLRAQIEDFYVDMVPGYYINKMISAVDRTPKHTRFLKKHLTPELADEVRLLKAFLKGIGAYGAEIKVGGLSGYACELLIVAFGSFINTLETFAKEKKIFIDFTKSWEEKKAFEHFRKKVILIDPVDRERNVVANLRDETLNLIKFASKMFLSDPSKSFFNPMKRLYLDHEIEKELEKRCIILLLLRKEKDIPPDTYWGQAIRIRNKIKNFIRKLPEVILYSIEAAESENYIILMLEVNKFSLSALKVLCGPPIWADIKDIQDFIKKHQKEAIAGPWIRNGKIVYLVRRPEKESLLPSLLEEYIKAVRMKPSFASFKVIHDRKEIMELVKREKIQSDFVNFIIRKVPWMY